MKDVFEMIPGDATVEIRDTPEFDESVERVSKYIAKLPLTTAQIETLAIMLSEMKKIRSKDAFMQGARYMMAILEWADQNGPEKVLN